MFNKVLTWLKARWSWMKGYCPTCNRKFVGAKDLYNYDCVVCEGRTDKLVIWSRYANRKPDVSHCKQPSGIKCCPHKSKDAVVEKS